MTAKTNRAHQRGGPLEQKQSLRLLEFTTKYPRQLRQRNDLLTLAVVLVACWFCHGVAGAAPIRIAYSSISGAMLPLWVANDKKLFDKHGVDVELAYIRGVAIEALLAGEVQFVRASPPAVVRSTLRGADLAIIANTSTLRYSR